MSDFIPKSQHIFIMLYYKKVETSQHIFIYYVIIYKKVEIFLYLIYHPPSHGVSFISVFT